MGPKVLSVFRLTPSLVAIAIQWMLAALASFSIKPPSRQLGELTQLGKSIFSPDRDLPIYLLGIGFAMFMGIVLERIRRHSGDCGGTRAATISGRRLALALAIIPLFPFCNELIAGRSPWPLGGLERPETALSMMPGLVATLILVFVRKSARTDGSRPTAPSLNEEPGKAALTSDATSRQKRLAGRLFDAAMIALVVSVVYIDTWPFLSSQTFIQDAFHHWDYFFMGPTVAFSHGKALVTEHFSLYGMGWPVLMNALSPVAPISYSTCGGIFLLGGTIYFVLYYLTLRYVARDLLVSSACFLLFMNLQLFNGLPSGATRMMWCWPSSSVLRSMFDLGFFFMLAPHGRSGRSWWLIAAAAFVALGLLFETDTGVYLTAALVYYVCVAGMQMSRSRVGPWSPRVDARTTAAVVATLISIVTAGYWIASRGTLFSSRFFEKWAEGIRVRSSGFWSLPIVKSGWPAVAIFIAMVVAATCLALMPLLTRRAGRPGFVDRYMGCWSAYALCSLVLFVNRSHPWNIFHCILPFGVLAAYLIQLLLDQVRQTVFNQMQSAFSVFLIPVVQHGIPAVAMVPRLVGLSATGRATLSVLSTNDERPVERRAEPLARGEIP